MLLVLVFLVLAAGYDPSSWLLLSITLSEHVNSLACLRASTLRGKAFFFVVFALYRNQMVFFNIPLSTRLHVSLSYSVYLWAILKQTESPRVAISATHLNWGYFVN